MLKQAICSLLLLLNMAQFTPSFPVWPEHLLSTSGCASQDAQAGRGPRNWVPCPCLSALLEFRGAGVPNGISSVPSLWAQLIRRAQASHKMQHLAFWLGHLAGNRKYSAPYLRAANFIKKYKHKIWVGSPGTQTLGPCFLFALPLLTDFAAQGPSCNMRESVFVFHVCALTYLTYFLVDVVFEADKAFHFFPLSIFWMILVEITKKSQITKLPSPVFISSSHLLLFISSSDISLLLLIKKLLLNTSQGFCFNPCALF